jgi:hypothetical protein
MSSLNWQCSCGHSVRLAPLLTKAVVYKTVNRRVRSQTLTVSFNKPLIPLALHKDAAQRAASESERCSLWWCFLEKARTFFEINESE